MKQIILFLSFFFSLVIGVNAQPLGMRPSNPMKKIEELEKIKLIESLQMNEETTLRFFSRWDQFKNNQHKLVKSSNEILDKLDREVSTNKEKNNPEINKMIDLYFGIEKQLQKNKRDFIYSLKDILDQNQIAKLLVFEKKFKDEIRNVLFRQRRHGPMEQ